MVDDAEEATVVESELGFGVAAMGLKDDDGGVRAGPDLEVAAEDPGRFGRAGGGRDGFRVGGGRGSVEAEEGLEGSEVEGPAGEKVMRLSFGGGTRLCAAFDVWGEDETAVGLMARMGGFGLRGGGADAGAERVDAKGDAEGRREVGLEGILGG